MSAFNLLPQRSKQALKWEIYARILHAATFFVVIWTIIFSITIFTAYQYLSIQREALAQRIEQVKANKETQEAEELENEIIALNTLLKTIATIKREKTYDAAGLLARVAPMVPSGSFLERFIFSNTTQLISLKGTAQLRSQVVTLQQNLERDNLFSDVEFPFSNLSKPQDVDFIFTITLPDQNE